MIQSFFLGTIIAKAIVIVVNIFFLSLQYDKILATEDGGEKFSDVLLFTLNNPTIESQFGCYGQLLGGELLNFPLAV